MAITIAGIARIGRPLVAVATPVYSDSTYQWSASDTEGGSYTNITGAVSPTYIPTAADWSVRGTLWLKCTHSYTDGEPLTETSAAFGPILSQQGGSQRQAQPRILVRYHNTPKRKFVQRRLTRQLQREI
jgi:hypothetical protein